MFSVEIPDADLKESRLSERVGFLIGAGVASGVLDVSGVPDVTGVPGVPGVPDVPPSAEAEPP